MSLFLALITIAIQLTTSQQWELIFDDEFDGTELNTSKWTDTFDQSRSGYPGELQYFSPSNVRLQNGSLVIETKYDPTYDNKTNITYPYTSGVISSQNKFSFTYGRVEIRAKLPTEKFSHLWPALWLQKQAGDCYEEIDIMEQWIGSFNNSVATSYHYNINNISSCGERYSSSIGWYPADKQNEIDFSKEYHIWTLIWNKTDITVWIDNDIAAYINGTEAMIGDEPEYILMNVMVCAESWCGGSSGIPKNVTEYLYVDYVRVYQLPDNKSEILR